MQMNHRQLLSELEEFVRDVPEPYWVGKKGVDLPSFDFNREIVKPSTNSEYPDGAVRILADWDFFTVAILPYRFRGLYIEEIAAALWPEIDTPCCQPDHGSWEWPRPIYKLEICIRALFYLIQNRNVEWRRPTDFGYKWIYFQQWGRNDARNWRSAVKRNCKRWTSGRTFLAG